MKDKRPVNLELSSIHLPLAAYTSILHRISGVIVFVGVAILLWIFDLSLSSEQGFNSVREIMTSPLMKFIVWGVLSALAYHLVAGVKHLLMDMGIGESKEAAPLGAKLTIVVSAVLIIALGGLDMVTNVTSFGRSGLYDWVVQRLSAVFLLLYILFLLYVFMTTPDMQYQDWQALFASNPVRIFSLVALLSLISHAWIGMWTISTDYLTPKMLGASAGKIRFLFELVCLLLLFVYFVWCIQILWGI